MRVTYRQQQQPHHSNSQHYLIRLSSHDGRMYPKLDQLISVAKHLTKRQELTYNRQVCLVPAIDAPLQVHHIISSQAPLSHQLVGSLQGAARLALHTDSGEQHKM